MTRHPVVELEDGTRRYSNYTRYIPVAERNRKYAIRKPQDPDAVRWHGEWFLPLPLLSDGDRVMPETRPDTDAYDHASKPRKCRCAPCQRPTAAYWQDRWRRGLTS